VQPVSSTDKIARQHDIDYLISNGSASQAFFDDMKAVTSITEITPESMAMATGLTLRSLINHILPGSANFNTPLQGYTESETREMGLMLNQILMDRYG